MPTEQEFYSLQTEHEKVIKYFNTIVNLIKNTTDDYELELLKALPTIPTYNRVSPSLTSTNQS